MEVSSARPVNQLATSYLFAIFHAAGSCVLVRYKSSEENKEKPLNLLKLIENALKASHCPNKMYRFEKSKAIEGKK